MRTFQLDRYVDVIGSAYSCIYRLRRLLDPYADLMRACTEQRVCSGRIVQPVEGEPDSQRALHALLIEPLAKSKFRFDKEGYLKKRGDGGRGEATC